MPKITFIKNIDDEIIYPKTHINAILTDTGTTIPEKFEILQNHIDEKSDNGHKHYYHDLLETPSSLPADGGNSDTVCHKTVNDNDLGSNILWTSKKIYNFVSEEINNNNSNIPSPIAITETEPENAIIWINPATNIMKYKYNNKWKQITFNISFVEETE